MSSRTTGLPPPDPEALAHSNQLKQFIVSEIRARGGWMDFAAMMGHLLYAPGLGYYAAGATKFGAAGDFVTAPEISGAFGPTIARAVAGLGDSKADLSILEPGAGTGALAASMLKTWRRLDVPVAQYQILEPSPYLQAIQRQTLEDQVPEYLDRVRWVSDIPEGFVGTVIANEVLDAMPVHMLVRSSSAWMERGVALNAQDDFVWCDRAADEALIAYADVLVTGLPPLDEGYVLEVPVAASSWLRTLGERMASGQVLLIDYGFPAREYYHPQRHQGTLMCHYRHLAHTDPFIYPGLQDITTHVDFTAVGRALMQAGFGLEGYDTQASFLLQHGLLEALDQGLTPGSVRWLAESTALQKLVSPAEMGELFKVILAQKGGDNSHDPRTLALLGLDDA